MIQKNKGGRPRKTDLYGGHIRAAEDQVADRLPHLMDNLFRLADGVTVQEEDREGNPRIYSRPPCRQSNEYLINRIMGKPVELQEISGPDGEALNTGTTVILLPPKELHADDQASAGTADSVPGGDD
jgi:hypothetical protein